MDWRASGCQPHWSTFWQLPAARCGNTSDLPSLTGFSVHWWDTRISPLSPPPTSPAGFFLSFEVLVPSHFKLSSYFYKLLYVQLDLLDSIHMNITRGELGFVLHASALSKTYKGIVEVQNQCCVLGKHACIAGCMRVCVCVFSSNTTLVILTNM